MSRLPDLYLSLIRSEYFKPTPTTEWQQIPTFLLESLHARFITKTTVGSHYVSYILNIINIKMKDKLSDTTQKFYSSTSYQTSAQPKRCI